MMLRFLSIIALSIGTICHATANNLRITNVTYQASAVTFDISWDNSWRGLGPFPEFHDAVWVFVKVAPNGGPQWNHVDISVSDDGGLDVISPADQKGAFVRASSQGSGTVSSTLTFDIIGITGIFPDIKVFGIEMVYIPTGSYSLGDGASDNRFHKGDDDTQPYVIASSNEIPYGTGPDDIFTSSPLLNGPIPADYPNGFDAFYCMKYEISQNQYAEFLNCLTLEQQNARTETDLSTGTWTNTYVMTNTSSVEKRNAIKCLPPGNGDPLFFFCDLDDDNIPNELADGRNLAMNYMSWDDLQAYLDWSALRPMSMCEYEKICRGPLTPIPNEFAWGTSTSTPPGNIVNAGWPGETFDNVGAGGIYGDSGGGKLARCGFAATATSNRLNSGATYYGVMEMTGNVPERICPVSAFGRIKENEFGDGILTTSGASDIFDSGFSSSGNVGFTVSYLSSVNAGTVGTARASFTGGRGVR